MAFLVASTRSQAYKRAIEKGGEYRCALIPLRERQPEWW